MSFASCNSSLSLRVLLKATNMSTVIFVVALVVLKLFFFQFCTDIVFLSFLFLFLLSFHLSAQPQLPLQMTVTNILPETPSLLPSQGISFVTMAHSPLPPSVYLAFGPVLSLLSHARPSRILCVPLTSEF